MTVQKMGVKRYLFMLKKAYTSPIVRSIGEARKDTYVDMLIIDGNCILHEIVSDTAQEMSPDENQIVASVVEKFKLMFAQTSFLNNNSIFKSNTTHRKICICFDGVPPEPKQFTQYIRRKNNLFLSSLLLPKTTFMRKIERGVIRNLQCDYIDVLSSEFNGEGEQKMIQYMRTAAYQFPNLSVEIVSFDSDAVILSQLYIMEPPINPINIFINVPSFGLYVNANLLTDEMLRKSMTRDKLLMFCAICGNDFFPKLTELTDIDIRNIFKIVASTDELLPTYFSLGMCKSKCTIEQVRLYIDVWKWYLIYFTTNQFINTKAYPYETPPCAHCLDVNSSYFNEPFKNLNIDTGNHLSNVLNRLMLEKENDSVTIV